MRQKVLSFIIVIMAIVSTSLMEAEAIGTTNIQENNPIAVSSHDIWVGGVAVTSENENNVTGAGIDGSVTYNPASSTLTLENVTIDATASYGTYSYIYTTRDIAIELIGDNSITVRQGVSYGRYSNRTVMISGCGSLDIAYQEGAGGHYYSGSSINAQSLDIEDSTVTLGEAITLAGGGDGLDVTFRNANVKCGYIAGFNYGNTNIICNNSVVEMVAVDGIAEVEINGGNVTASVLEECGIKINAGKLMVKTIDSEHDEVNISGTSQVIVSGGDGVCCDTLTMVSGELDVKNVNANTSGAAIQCEVVNMTGGSLNAVGPDTTHTSQNQSSKRIIVEKSGSADKIDFVVSGGVLTAVGGNSNSQSIGVRYSTSIEPQEELKISNATVNLSGNGAVWELIAIDSLEQISIDGNSKITIGANTKLVNDGIKVNDTAQIVLDKGAKYEATNLEIDSTAKIVFSSGSFQINNLKAISNGEKAVTLSWGARTGVDGYLIYGIRPEGKYGYIGMTTKGATYMDMKASKLQYTFYWVYPYHLDNNGSMIVGGTARYTYGRTL